MESSKFQIEIIRCQVCGRPGHGKHYDALTCRACAAFFRRAKTSKMVRKCRKGNNCQFFKNGFYNCKHCRLQQCILVGMTTEGFQFDRDLLSSAERTFFKLQRSVPPSMSNFLGRPTLIIFSQPQTLSPKKQIDFKFLLDRVAAILSKGPESPIHSKSRLQKMGLGLVQTRKTTKMFNPTECDIMGKDEMLSVWETDVVKLARWLSYFDDFRRLPEDSQLKLIVAFWKIWNRLEMLSLIASKFRSMCPEEDIRKIKKGTVLCSWEHMEYDMSWCSNKPLADIKYFVDLNNQILFDELTQSMAELNPSEEELSFMMCQLCFHYVSKNHQGEIQKVAEKFQDEIANDLHSYYTKELKRPIYSDRVAKMMKINNQIQQNVYRNRAKIELAIVFDIFQIECSHPQLFMDM